MPRIRLVFLGALAAAFLLVPVAGAAAANGNLTVNIEGGGDGEVVTNTEFFGGLGITTPPIACSYTAPGPATGQCTGELEFFEEENRDIAAIKAIAPAGTEFLGFSFEEGEPPAFCEGERGEEVEPGVFTCVVYNNHEEDAAFTAFFQPLLLLTVSKAGSGTGAVSGGSEAQPNTINCGGECENEYAEGEEVTLEAQPDPGSYLEGWSGGGCTGRDTCTVPMTQAQNVTASFGQGTPLIVNVNGEGTVTSNPAGINCSGGEQCIEAFEGTVTLTAVPGTGYVIAGWLGCHQAAGDPTTCTVKVDEERDVTAVFLTEGTQGAPGQGVTVTAEPAGANCANGGVKVVSSSGTTYVCNGPAGSNGSNGANGSDGKDGDDGKDGANGTAGPQGAAGPQGTQGAQGPQGPAGKVTCKVKQKGAKVKVTCKVKTAAASSSRLRWRLMRSGHAYSHGTARHGRLQLDLSHLRRGRYVLHLQGQRGGTPILIG